MTDEAPQYKVPGRGYASHDAVNHGEKEYARYWNEVTDQTRPDGKPIVVTKTITTNTVEGYYSIFNRGMKGVYQHCAEKHLHRYLADFPLFEPRDAWRQRWGKCDPCHEGYREQASHVPAD